MPRLHIYVNEKEGKTVSKFGKPQDTDKIVFHNQHGTETLKVKVLGDAVANKALCQGSASVPEFSVGPKAKEAFTICPGYLAKEFEYTAQIGTFALEDPIIIIEKSSYTVPTVSVTAAVVLALVAATLGYFAGLKRARGGSPKN